MADNQPGFLRTLSAVIASGESLSAPNALGTFRLVGLIMPASWTSANLTFQISVDRENFSNFYDDLGTEVTVTAAASRYIALDPALFAGCLAIKIRSGTSGSPVNQGGDRTISLVTRPV